MAQTTIIRPAAITGPTITEADGSTFTFDALLSEAPTDEADLTQHPVEDGADITDHWQRKPTKLTIAVGFTNSPLPGQGESTTNRDLALYADLIALFDRGELLTLVTGLRVYRNMVMTSLSTTRDPSTGQALLIQIALSEVRLTTTETVDIPADVTRKRSGRQNAEALATATATASASTADSAGIVAAASATGIADDPEVKVIEKKDTSAALGLFR